MSVRLLPLALTNEQLSIVVDPSPPPEANDATHAHWDREASKNPRLFNGPILSLDRFDEPSSTLFAKRDTYRRLIAQHASPPADNGVVHLSVTGIMLATDADNRPHVLLAKRSPDTGVYPNLWEIAPSGGLDPRPEDRMDGADAWRQLILELEEEVSLPVAPDPAPIVALLYDDDIKSCDIVFKVELVRPLEDIMLTSGETGWEYERALWLALDEIDAFLRTHDDVTPPTRTLLRSLI